METVIPGAEDAGHQLGVDQVEPSWFGTTPARFAMWLFIMSDALTFGGLLTGYGFMRLTSAEWPNRMEVFDMRLITFMTFVLISSSAAMAMAVGAARTRDVSAAVRMLGATIAGGVVFLLCQAFEWSHLIAEGATPFKNPWGVPQFGASFFVITGFHGLHVLSGVVVLATVLLRALKNKYSAEGVEVAGLYWHFVDVVWVFVFAFFYLL